MKSILPYFCWLFLLPMAHSQKQICITIDDLPVVSYGIQDSAYWLDITNRLVQTFDFYQMPAIGYVNENKLYQDGQLQSNRVKLLEQWLQAGYELGNHTYAHTNYHRTDFQTYTAGILKGETITRPMTKQYNQPLRFFRHPYLRLGQTKARHDSLQTFLQQQGYTEAPVTIDNEEYLFAKAYHIAYHKKGKAMARQIGKDYVDYMERKLHYFERSADSLFQRPIRHILLLHANLLNAHYLDELADMLLKNGYTFISQSAALEDPVYQRTLSSQAYGDWGISWLDRWALTEGKKGSFFKEEPRVPDYIDKMTKR